MFNLLDESVSCQVLRCRRPAYVSARGHRRSRRPPSCSASTAPGSATPTEPSDFSPWSSPSLTVRADAGSDVCSGFICYYLTLWMRQNLILSTANEVLQPEQRHPLPSYRDYINNSSIRAYQTAYFASRCPPDADTFAGQVTTTSL